MPFNPIIKQVSADARLTDEIKLGMVGVVHQKGRYTRTLNPGEELPWLERRQRDTVYIVDTRPQILTLIRSLPDKEHDRFPLEFNVVCQVEKHNAARVVERHITDVDGLVAQTLDTIVRPLCRKKRLHEYDQLLSEIQDDLDFTPCASLGITCSQSSVEIRRSPEFDERVEQLRAIDLAKKVAQHQKHTTQLPSNTAGLPFEADISLTYQVARADELPSQDLRVVEQHLWEYLEPKLRRQSRRFPIEQMSEAEESVEGCLEELDIIYGLRVKQLRVALSTDQEITARYRARQVDAIDDESAAARKVRHAKALSDFLEVYRNLVAGGQRELLALRLANDPANVDMIMQQLSTLEAEEFRRNIEQVRTLADAGNHLNGVVDNEIQTIFRIIVNRFFGATVGEASKLLSPIDSHKPLPETKDANSSSASDATDGVTTEPEDASDQPEDIGEVPVP